jgi:hypothetical protein
LILRKKLVECSVVCLEKKKNCLLEITVTSAADYFNHFSHAFAVHKAGNEFAILRSELLRNVGATEKFFGRTVGFVENGFNFARGGALEESSHLDGTF